MSAKTGSSELSLQCDMCFAAASSRVRLRKYGGTVTTVVYHFRKISTRSGKVCTKCYSVLTELCHIHWKMEQIKLNSDKLKDAELRCDAISRSLPWNSDVNAIVFPDGLPEHVGLPSPFCTAECCDLVEGSYFPISSFCAHAQNNGTM